MLPILEHLLPVSLRRCVLLGSWLLEDVQSTYHSANRVLGGMLSPYVPSLTIQYSVPGASGQWTPETFNGGNLNGSIQALDCYSSPESCLQNFWSQMQPGLLSREGWVALDDVRLHDSSNIAMRYVMMSR